MITTILGGVTASYLMLVGGMAIGQRGMIYFPSDPGTAPEQAGVPEMSPVPVSTADGLEIHGWYAPPRQPGAALVVLFHGNTGHLSHRATKARLFLDLGFGVFLVGYRGYGSNPGSPSEQGLYADSRAVLNWLLSNGTDVNRICLYGESLGTGVAVQMATEYPVGTVILEAPFTRLPDLAPPILIPPLPDWLMVDHYDSQAKISSLQAPLLIMHGDCDTTVPSFMGRSLFKAALTEKESLFVAAAGHNDLWNYGGGTVAADFMRRKIGNTPLV